MLLLVKSINDTFTTSGKSGLYSKNILSLYLLQLILIPIVKHLLDLQ